VMQGDSGLV